MLARLIIPDYDRHGRTPADLPPRPCSIQPGPLPVVANCSTEERRMRILIMAILTTAAMAGTAPVLAQTYDPNYPVCMQVFGRVSYMDCRFTSLPQCKAAASGRSAGCLVNPYYRRGPAGPASHRRAY
jgi:Protein of unknown function (DUF3551)